MKLLLVTHYMPPHEGGIERIAEDHARAAARAGHEVSWIASRAPAGLPAGERTEWGQADRVAALNFLETALGVPYPVWLPGARWRIGRAVAACDLVHVHDLLYPGSSLALAAARRLGKPALVTQHVGFVPYTSRAIETLERLAWRVIGRRNLRLATRIAVYTPAARDWLVRACGFTGEAVFLPNAVDTAGFRPAADPAERAELRRAHGLPAGARIALFAGRLVPKKGAALLLSARLEGWHLLLLGERGELALAPDRPDVELRPFQPRPVLAELMRAADAFVLPSRGEGFPLVAQEAMASGLPVVLGEDSSYIELVDPGSLLLVPHDPGAIEQAFARLRDPGLRRQLGTRARATALARWSPERCHARLLDLYGSLVSARRGQPGEAALERG